MPQVRKGYRGILLLRVPQSQRAREAQEAVPKKQNCNVCTLDRIKERV